MRLAWAAASHRGLRRPSNEDSYVARLDLGLFVVADGMGGHVAGEVASRIAVESIEGFIAETASAGPEDTWPYPFDTSFGLDANRLSAAFRLANRHIGTRMSASHGLRGMATTASAVLVSDHHVAVAHVGDSRVYLLRAGDLERLTRDHSWVEEQVRAGALSPTAARQHPWRNVVTRALSGGADPDVDLGEHRLDPGDRLLLCSDGLCVATSDERIRALLEQGIDLESICDGLVGAANDGGGPDNITVLVLQAHAE